MTTEIPSAYEPGAIHRAQITFWLADGTRRGWSAPVLILDAERVDAADTNPTMGGLLRVMWTPMALHADGSWLPEADPQWSLIWGNGQDALKEASSRDAAVSSKAVGVHLIELTGTYKPHDPKFNSIEILRANAYKQLEQRQQHTRADLETASQEWHMDQAREKASKTKLDEVIRRELANKTSSAWEISNVTRLSVPRIYQIRDKRR